MTRHAGQTALVILLFACLPAPAVASEKALWELGIGVTGLYFPDYPGSDQSSPYALPFPYVVYRGEILKADRHGVRGIFFDTDRIELNISLGASLPVSSDDNRARQGMPDLDPTVEVGPSLDINLWRTSNRRYKLDLRLPVRTAITVRGGVDDIGWVFSPRLNLDIVDVAGLTGWNLGLLAGPMYGSERNHDYFYSVAPQYATPDRPAYDAEGGYAGSQFLVAMSKRYRKYWVGAFARWDRLEGAAFADSPLVEREYSFSAGIGVAWILGESSTRVEAFE
jgi:outer membrane scaffolding protein for murein synthesis (MipA/OmpV family)